jgi:hypothetical protein
MVVIRRSSAFGWWRPSRLAGHRVSWHRFGGRRPTGSRLALGRTAPIVVTLLFFLTVPMLVLADQDPRQARIALVVADDGLSGASALLMEAALAAITSVEGAFWFRQERLEAVSARGSEAPVIAHLQVGRLTGDGNPDPVAEDTDATDESFLVELDFYRVPRSGTLSRDPLDGAVVTTSIDRAGRYLRSEAWEELVEATRRVHGDARPVSSVTFRSPIPVTIVDAPGWLQDELPDQPVREATLELRTLRNYGFTLHAPGYRPEEVSFYLEREPLTIAATPVKYPRHTVAFMARGLSWPGFEYAWYDSATRWTVQVGITSFALGLTPLRQLAYHLDLDDRDNRSPGIISSYPLTEIEVGGGRLLGDRDSVARWLVSGGVLLRLTHGEELGTGLEPVNPAALRFGIGREREVRRRWILSQRLATEWYWPVRESFLTDTPWSYQIGPILWQLPVYRVGMRVVL